MREIVLTKGFRVLVDDEDYESLARHRWTINASRVESRRLAHAARRDGGRTIMMHREIMAAPPGVHVDHLRHHDLGEKIIDNRRSNLRLATRPLDRGEVADVLFLAFDLCQRADFKPAEVMREKLAELRTRTWGGPDADGVVEHVRREPDGGQS